jgi:hypothetical protein
MAIDFKTIIEEHFDHLNIFSAPWNYQECPFEFSSISAEEVNSQRSIVRKS